MSTYSSEDFAQALFLFLYQNDRGISMTSVEQGESPKTKLLDIFAAYKWKIEIKYVSEYFHGRMNVFFLTPRTTNSVWKRWFSKQDWEIAVLITQLAYKVYVTQHDGDFDDFVSEIKDTVEPLYG